MDGDVADVFAVQIGFVSNRADDVAGFDVVLVTHFDAEALHAVFQFARGFFTAHAFDALAFAVVVIIAFAVFARWAFVRQCLCARRVFFVQQ
jgi:hypothetical protein